MTNKPTVVSCPTCRADVIWSLQSPDRPFCSERCKLIDLGQWANEGYRIPVTAPPAFDEADPQ